MVIITVLMMMAMLNMAVMMVTVMLIMTVMVTMVMLIMNVMMVIDVVDFECHSNGNHLMQLYGGAWSKMADNNVENSLLQIIYHSQTSSWELYIILKYRAVASFFCMYNTLFSWVVLSL